MLIEDHGNILEAPADALVNTVNTVGIMGKGLALQFKQAYPGNFHAYEAACRQGEVRLGNLLLHGGVVKVECAPDADRREALESWTGGCI